MVIPAREPARWKVRRERRSGPGLTWVDAQWRARDQEQNERNRLRAAAMIERRAATARVSDA
jgi:hypothetical protein